MPVKRDYKAANTFDYNHYETDPKLLELIKSTTASYKASQFAKKSNLDHRIHNYEV